MLRYPAINTTRGRKSPSGRTLWCGPFLVALLTGLPYDEAYAKLLADIRRAIMKKRRAVAERGWRGTLLADRPVVSRAGLPTQVKGTYEHQIARLLGKLGVAMKLTYTWAPITLLTFAREHTVKGKTYAVAAGHHWLVLKDGLLYHSHHAPLPIDEAPRYRMARVECWAEVRPRPAALLS